MVHTMTYTNTKPYDKRDDFNFHILNFPLLGRNIPAEPTYGVIFVSVETIFQSLWFLSSFLDRGEVTESRVPSD
jgi:hypothetical protein